MHMCAVAAQAVSMKFVTTSLTATMRNSQNSVCNSILSCDHLPCVRETCCGTFILLQIFIKKLALFFVAFLRPHLSALENPASQAALLEGLSIVVRVSEVPDDEVFKICLEYYHSFTQVCITNTIDYY
jgi:Chromosome region maintenance or exportin repeat